MSATYTKRFYNLTAPIYDMTVNWAYKKGRSLLQRELKKCSGTKALEIGAGTGLNIPYIPNRFEYTGVDISPMMISKAKKKSSRSNLQIMNGEQTTFADCTFDVVILSHVLTVTEHPHKMIMEVNRLLRPGGRLIVMNSLHRSNHWITKPIKQVLALKSFRMPAWESLGFKLINRTSYGYRDQLSFIHLQKH